LVSAGLQGSAAAWLLLRLLLLALNPQRLRRSQQGRSSSRQAAVRLWQEQVGQAGSRCSARSGSSHRQEGPLHAAGIAVSASSLLQSCFQLLCLLNQLQQRVLRLLRGRCLAGRLGCSWHAHDWCSLKRKAGHTAVHRCRVVQLGHWWGWWQHWQSQHHRMRLL
jgi:hypothetical protein